MAFYNSGLREQFPQRGEDMTSKEVIIQMLGGILGIALVIIAVLIR